jgi:N-acetylneuraminic acid mutarotase
VYKFDSSQEVVRALDILFRFAWHAVASVLDSNYGLGGASDAEQRSNSTAGFRPHGAKPFKVLLPLAAFMVSLTLCDVQGQAPNLLSYQGRILVSGNAFTGTGQFKFALVSADGSQTYWRNSADLNNDGQPDIAVPVPVNGGLFTVYLGDTNLPGMAALPASVFTNASVHLRIWFNDGSNGVQQLAPDQTLASAAYALIAGDIGGGGVGGLSARVDALTAQLSGSIMSGSTISSLDPQDALLQSEGFRLFTTVAAPGWVTSPAQDSPLATIGQAGVWTGQQLLVWGGNLGAGIDSSSGAGYRPDLDLWQTISSSNAPAARDQHSAVWSGKEMIVWGGASSGNFVNTGGRFNPSNAVWTAVSTNGAPAGRIGHVAAWTGSRMVVWGGRSNLGVLGDGGYYDPVADQWTALAASGAPSPRFGAAAVSTGDRILVWGGTDPSGALSNGAQLLFGTNGVPTAWVAMSTVNAPSARSGHSLVWTGQKLLVWGGQSGGSFLADGGLYDPIANSWTAIAATNGPAARSAHGAVWSGQEMLVFGGEAYLGTLADGAAYDPQAGQWRPLSGIGNPQARSGATVAWSGTAMLVFGGLANGSPVSSLQILNPQPTWYFYRKP